MDGIGCQAGELDDLQDVVTDSSGPCLMNPKSELGISPLSAFLIFSTDF